MRKAMFLMALMMIGATVHAVQIVPKANIDLPGKFSMSGNGVTLNGDTATGFGLGMECLAPVYEKLKAGIGLQYLLGRKVTSLEGRTMSDNNAFGHVPLYGTLQYSFSLPANPYIPSLNMGYGKVNLGYSMAYYGNDDFKGTTTMNGGLYWGIGAGTIINDKIVFEIMYDSFKGEQKAASGLAIDEPYNKVSISIGYLFDLK